MRNVILAGVVTSLLYQPVQAACSADSGNRRQHLLELYTSEGCSSCPPADKFLSKLKEVKDIVPLAFHVDYWDRLGWSDRFAKAEFSRRQQASLEHNGGGFRYTPQFVLNGRDWRTSGYKASWRAKQVEHADRLSLQLDRQDKDKLAVEGNWSGRSGQVYVALYENDLESHVVAGENTGHRLHHDFVVRELIGPLAVANGVFRHTFSLRPMLTADKLGVAAFVAQPGAVLQAVQRPLCSS
jgi:hypothetical protein